VQFTERRGQSKAISGLQRKNRCWETRGLKKKEQLRVARGKCDESDRDFTEWLNEWAPVARLNV